MRIEAGAGAPALPTIEPMNHPRLVLALVISGGAALAACGGGSGGVDLCASATPPPECMIACDPSGVPATCPSGFHCSPDGTCQAFCTQGGSECADSERCSPDGRCIPEDQCVGLECMQVSCSNGGTTSLSGIVYAPNGTLPLYNVNVYVPNAAVGPLPTGASCDRCNTPLSGAPLVQTTTGTDGRFTLTNVPATSNVPLVLQVGKWRRQVTIPTVAQCVDTPLDAGSTRLPRNQGEGDIPQMALTTGGADALECLLRKVGLDDAEFTTAGGTGRVHLYAGSGGTPDFDAGGAFADAQTLWSDTATLSAYDVAFLSCEGAQNPGTKGPAALAAMKAYADLGGRVFASHWHNYWILDNAAPWDGVMTFNDQPDLNSIEADINQTFARGGDLAQWLLNVGASNTLGKIDIDAAQHTVTGVDESLADRWIYKDQTANGSPSVQYLSYTTPLEAAPAQRCGRVVFSDIHVSSGDDSGGNLSFPSGGCTSPRDQLSPQEKVLAFMIFDIASCISEGID